MRFLADENVPLASVTLLRGAGHDVQSVAELYPGSSDANVLQQAAAERRIVLTFDRDFGELIYRSGFSGRPGVVYFRHPPRNPEDPASRLLDLLAASQAELTGMLTVIGTTEVRQRPLP